ncbi:hypothetical protein Tsubulata_039860 [Turnera subulata]|uniref:UspA domain-containing protein n=1 Tax=Turnera subulata TaxID=218843 RepID=A0A9Q0J5M3_9ROSI|nr:hypothetical protein Tsubulata_039860 [Turnera subulata]
MEKGRDAAAGCVKKVMVAIDESEYSYHALIWALDNLKEVIAGSSLVIFATQPNPDCFHTYGAHFGSSRTSNPIPAGRSLVSKVVEQKKELSLHLLEKARSICLNRGVKAETITEAGEPRELICNAVEVHKIDLLVVANHPTGFPKSVFQGSLGDYCSKNAKCQVLVVSKQE